MSRYLVWFFLPLLATAAVGALLFVLSAGAVDDKSFRSVAVLDRKIDLAKNAPHPLVLLVGGSGVHYGISAETIADATGRPAINFGLRAGLGAAYMLFEARRVLAPGDTAILALEFSAFGSEAAINRISTTVSLARGLTWFRSLSWRDRVRYLRALPRSRLISGLVAWLRVPRDPEGKDPVAGITAFGDETRNRPDRASRARLAAMRANPDAPPGFDAGGDGVRAIRAFVSWARANDITVYAAWPSHMDYPEFQGREFDALVRSVAALYDDLDVKMIDTVTSSRLSCDLMYDSQYHPSDAGRRLRMTRFMAPFCTATKLCLNETSPGPP